MPIRKVGDSAWAMQKNVYRVFKTRKHAERFACHHAAALARLKDLDLDEEKPCCAIRDKLDEFLADSLAGIGRKPCNSLTASLHRRRLLMFDRAFHSKSLDAVTRGELEGWIRRRLRQRHRGVPIERDTVNADLVSLRAFSVWAQRKGYAPPALSLLTVGRLQTGGKMAGENRKPPKLLNIHQLLEVIAKIEEARPDIGLFLMGMLLFVLRPAAVAGLRRSDLRLPGKGAPGGLAVRGLKGFHARTLAIEPESRRHDWARRCLALRVLPDAGGDGPLVPCIGGRSRRNPGGWTTATLDQAVARVCRDLNFDFTFTPYQIRHSLLAWLHNQEGISLANVRTAAGHARITTQNFYAHATASEAQPAYAAIDAILDQRDEGLEGTGGAVSTG